jgi:hypothetical protein
MAVLVVFGGFALSTSGNRLSAQSNISQIKIESHEVVVPIEVTQETKDPKGIISDSQGNLRGVWILRFNEITNLPPKSVHIFEDGVEQKIQHFSFERLHGWGIQDNIGQHQEYSCTPRGIWAGPDIMRTDFFFDDHRLHTYLLTYAPSPSAKGSCHQITIKVDRKHATVFAPDQYCNTDDPLSDPLKDTRLGNELVSYAKSEARGNLPLSVQINSFKTLTEAQRVDLSVAIPPNLLTRKWDGINLKTSIAILGLVFDQHNELAAEFTDVACLPGEMPMGYQGPFPIPGDIKQVWEQVIIPSNYRTQVALKPGDYRVELVLTDGEKFGRKTASITVDDFTKEPLSISAIALCKRYHKPSPDEKGPTRAPQYVPFMFDGMEFRPAGDTRFKTSEQLFAYLEIYDSEIQSGSGAKTYLEMKVTDETTHELKIGTAARLVDSPLRSENPAIPMVWDMEIGKLSPGSYRLEAQASDSMGHKTEWRAASFSVQ